MLTQAFSSLKVLQMSLGVVAYQVYGWKLGVGFPNACVLGIVEMGSALGSTVLPLRVLRVLAALL